MEWRNKRVFVTGGAGFIGSHLCEELDLYGVKLGLLVHRTQPKIRGEIIYGDLRRESDDLYHFLRDFQPEVIFHLAAQPIVCKREVDERETLQTNMYGTANILHACKNLKNLRSFVHISTDKVYGNVSPITKDTAPNGTGHPYNTSKLAGDYLAQMYANFYEIPTAIVRNANVYGAGDTHFDRIIPRTIRNILQGLKPIIRGNGSNTRDYVYVDDVVQGYMKIAELPYIRGGLTTINLSGFNHSVLDVIDTILGKMRAIDLFPLFEKQWDGEIPHQRIVNDIAQELIGWNPKTDLDCGLDKTINWYVENYGTR